MSSTAKAKSDTEPGTDRRAAGEAYREDGYVLLEKLFPEIVLGKFHQRLQQDLDLRGNPAFLARGDLLTKPAIEVYSHQYPPMAAFHWGLTPIATELAGVELVPSYAYYRAYQQGDVCLVHSDRPACEHSLSLVIHLAEEVPWALSIERAEVENPGGVTPDFGANDYASLPMRAGDGVMYRGVEHRHARLEPNPNSWSAHLFLHWVDANGPYAEHAFDRVKLEMHGLTA